MKFHTAKTISHTARIDLHAAKTIPLNAEANLPSAEVTRHHEVSTASGSDRVIP